MTSDFAAFQQQVITEIRAHAGRVGGMFEGSPLVLLATVGARTGLPRTSPLAYLEIDGQPLVVASPAGTHPPGLAPQHPRQPEGHRRDRPRDLRGTGRHRRR